MVVVAVATAVLVVAMGFNCGGGETAGGRGGSQQRRCAKSMRDAPSSRGKQRNVLDGHACDCSIISCNNMW